MTLPLTSDRFPVIPIRVRIEDVVLEVDAIIDTGFDGALVLPYSLISDNIEPEVVQTWGLAGGTRIDAPSYRATVQIGQFPAFSALAVRLGTEALVGIRVIRRFGVYFDHGRRVVVEP